MYPNRVISIFCLLFCITLFMGCGGDELTGSLAVISRIEIEGPYDPSSFDEIDRPRVGTRGAINATIYDASGREVDNSVYLEAIVTIELKSSDTKVIEAISKTGIIVLFKKVGQATITAHLGNVKSNGLPIAVY